MITTQHIDDQTGFYSRLPNPYVGISDEALRASTHNARVLRNPPVRNPLAGASGEGLFARIAAWFRGER
jgi:hypothetical protein